MRRACLYYELQNELFVRNRQAVALFLPTIHLVTTRLDYTCQLYRNHDTICSEQHTLSCLIQPSNIRSMVSKLQFTFFSVQLSGKTITGL